MASEFLVRLLQGLLVLLRPGQTDASDGTPGLKGFGDDQKIAERRYLIDRGADDKTPQVLPSLHLPVGDAESQTEPLDREVLERVKHVVRATGAAAEHLIQGKSVLAGKRHH